MVLKENDAEKWGYRGEGAVNLVLSHNDIIPILTLSNSADQSGSRCVQLCVVVAGDLDLGSSDVPFAGRDMGD
ncbi:hypothetical protein P3S68_001005 [Capsicum galapagoense]